jgi:hypothetical protein
MGRGCLKQPSFLFGADPSHKRYTVVYIAKCVSNATSAAEAIWELDETNTKFSKAGKYWFCGYLHNAYPKLRVLTQSISADTWLRTISPGLEGYIVLRGREPSLRGNFLAWKLSVIVVQDQKLKVAVSVPTYSSPSDLMDEPKVYF